MSLQRCQRETTSTEFVEWQEYFRLEANQPKREHYYLAQIALEIRRIFAKSPNLLKLDHFLFRFNSTNKPEHEQKLEDLEGRTARSKAAWFTIAGVGRAGKLRTRTPPKR